MPSWPCPGSTLALALMLGVAMATAIPAPASSRTSVLAAAPDLVLTEMTPTPEVVHENEVVQLDVRIENQGDMAAWAATVTFVDVRPNGHGVPIGDSFLPSPLDAGESVVLSGPAFIAVGVGNHTVTARIDEVMPPDSETSNNLLVIRLTVRPAEGNPGTPQPSDTVRIEALQGLGIGGLVAIVTLAIAGWAISAGMRRSRDDSLVPPPPEPPDRRPPPIWPP
jgi:hypothetical protein